MSQIEGAIELVNLGIRLLAALQLGAPIMQSISDRIAAAVREGRQLTDVEVNEIREAAELALRQLESKTR